MKNNLPLKGLLSKIVTPLERNSFSIPVKSKNNLIQLSALSTPVLVGILFFCDYLIYTLQPSVWHWGFDSTITWENPTINWENSIAVLCPLFCGLTLFQLAFNQLNKFNKELRPRLLSSEQTNIRNIKGL